MITVFAQAPICTTNRLPVWSFWLFVVALLISGCQHTKPMSAQIDANPKPAPSYSDLVLNYETTNFCSLVSKLRAASFGPSTQLSAESTESATESLQQKSGLSEQCSQARIQIIYPHPDGSTEKGLARLIVTRKIPDEKLATKQPSAWKTQLTKLIGGKTDAQNEVTESTKNYDQEVWHLDLAKEELDILLSELSHRGFFEQQERPRGDAIVSIQVDEGELCKRWTSEPRLEGLMIQVYNEGELTAFHTHNSRIVPISTSREKI